MAEKITSSVSEALKMADGCRIRGAPVLQKAEVMLIPMESLAGERFILRIEAISTLGKNGNLITLNTGFQVDMLTPVTDQEKAMGNPPA